MWPFSRKKKDTHTLPSVQDESYPWAVGKMDLDFGPLLIRLNVGAKPWVGNAELPVKLGFAIPFNDPQKGGLPLPNENEQLHTIEDIILRDINAHTRGIHVLVLTSGTMREMVFYVPEKSDIKKIHETIQANVSTHEVQCMAVREPQWDSYLEFSLK